MTEKIREKLFALRDDKYRLFNAKLLPALPSEKIIGVRTPALKALAKELSETKEGEIFLASLPHQYFEENNLHAFLIERINDPEKCMKEIERFLPYVDNWATCDQMSPKAIVKNKDTLKNKALEWIHSGHTYTVRYGILTLMRYFLDKDFSTRFLAEVAAIRSDEYYVNMMCAWYFATALAKQYAAAITYLEERSLPLWVHNKAIQKSVESYRIPSDKKEYLKTLRIKSK